MALCTNVCAIEPFKSAVTPEGRDVEILRSELEDYLQRMLAAMCADIQCVEAKNRVFTHAMEAFDGGTMVTALPLFIMERLAMGAGAASVNPGFTKETIATDVFIDWRIGFETVPGPWTLRLRRNLELVDLATFTMEVTAGAGLQNRTFGPWVPQVTFVAGDSYHVVADGPEKNFLVVRPILRFEEVNS